MTSIWPNRFTTFWSFNPAMIRNYFWRKGNNLRYQRASGYARGHLIALSGAELQVGTPNRNFFSKLHVFRGVQHCEVTYEDHVATTSLRFRHRSYRLFPGLTCNVWSVLRLVDEALK